MTLIMIIVIALTIIAVYNRHKMEQIVGLSHREILNKHQKAFNTYKGWLIFAIILFTGGYLLAKCYPMYETENYEYRFFGTQKGTREVLTASAWWSYILRGLGILIGIPVLIGFLDRWRAIRRYRKMTQLEYTNFQQQMQSEIIKQDEATKRAKRTRTIIGIIGRIINGGY